MAIEGTRKVDYSGRHRPRTYPRSAIKQATPDQSPPFALGGRGARGLSAPESGSGYWLGLSDAITVTGLSR